MERIISVAAHQQSAAATTTKKKKTRKGKKDPVKVVYISNPVKFKTSASKFRDLVQKLTGQDGADLPPSDDGDDDEDHNRTVQDDDQGIHVPHVEELQKSPYDDDCLNLMGENLSGWLLPSSNFYSCDTSSFQFDLIR